MKGMFLRCAAVLMLVLPGFGTSAGADQNTSQTAGTQTVTATTTNYSFSNAGYGPWSLQVVEYRRQLRDDAPAFTLVDRNDVDGPSATQSTGLYLDDYHTFSNHFYVYAQVGSASGTVLPSKIAYFEGDLKLGAPGAIVLAAGGAAMQNADGSTTHYLSAGPTIYDGRLSFSVRFMPSNTNGIATSATQFGVQYNEPGANAVALAFLTGTQPNVLVGLPASAAGFQHVSQAVLTFKHWINPHEGFVVGETLGNFADASGKNNSYRQRGVTFGVFIQPR